MCSMLPLVSVIVPVYNNEDYIAQALDSLVDQSLTSDLLEIIVIDDGSDDSTPSICDSYAESHPNMLVVHQGNCGVGNARNHGLDLAQGKYVAFLDSDDTLDPQTLETAARFFDDHYSETDAVVYPMRLFDSTREWPHVREEVLTRSGIYDLKKLQNAFALITNVNVVVKNTESLPRFQEDLLVHEDELFFMNVLLDKLTVGFSKSGCYRYRQEGGSAVYTKMHPFYQFEENIGFWEALFARYPEKVPLYLQASYLNELNWKLRKDCVFPYHYSVEELERATSRISKLVSRISNDLILLAPRSDEFFSSYILSLKDDQDMSCELTERGLILKANREPVLCRKDILAELVRTKEIGSLWHVEGVLQSFAFPFFEKPMLTATIETQAGATKTLAADIRASSRSMHLAHIPTCTFWNFEIDLPLDKDAIISFELTLNAVAVPLSFVFSNRSSLSSEAGIMTCCCGGAIIEAIPEKACFAVKRTTSKKMVRTALIKNDSSVFRRNKKAFLMRSLLRMPSTARKPIWLYYDRVGVGKDNAYYQFIHDFEKHDGIARYYITDNTKADNRRLFSKAQLSHVVPFSSNRHRYLHLKASKVIVAYVEHENWRPFHQKALDSVADLVSYELVYLQHGVIHAHMPWKYSADRVLVDREVVSTSYEQTVLRNTYGFTDRKLITSGMPRYDYVDNAARPKNKILFAPSWRKYLVDENPPLTFHPKNKLFEESAFWRTTRRFLESPSLHQLLDQCGYELDIKLHPIFSAYAPYFRFSHPSINLVDSVDESEYKIFITDYSSWVFDFVYLKRAIAYFLPDVDEFNAGLNGYRKLDLPIEHGFGPVATTEPELLHILQLLIENDGWVDDTYLKRMDGFFLHYDNEQCERLYNELIIE